MKRCVADTKAIGDLFMVSVRGSSPRDRRSSGRWCRHRETDDTRGHKGTPRTIQQTKPLHSTLIGPWPAAAGAACSRIARCGVRLLVSTSRRSRPRAPSAASAESRNSLFSWLSAKKKSHNPGVDDVDACFVDVRKSERCDSDAGYDDDDDDDGLLADHVPARAQTLATGADEVSDEDLGAYTAVLDREAMSSWATNVQMECQLARLNVMAKRSLKMKRETNRQLEQMNRQLLSARTARVEEPTHAQSPDCDDGISEVHAGPDDPIMVEVDAMTADEASGSSTDSDHG